MGLLSRKNPPSAPAPVATAVTIIAHGTHLEGRLSLHGGVHVDGGLRGDILCAEHVCVGTTGTFSGSIKARQVLISGAFEGSIDCERLEITDTGLVIGEVTCDDLVIDGGGRFSGSRRARESALALPQDQRQPPALEHHFEPAEVALPPLIGTSVRSADPADDDAAVDADSPGASATA